MFRTVALPTLVLTYRGIVVIGLGNELEAVVKSSELPVAYIVPLTVMLAPAVRVALVETFAMLTPNVTQSLVEVLVLTFEFQTTCVVLLAVVIVVLDNVGRPLVNDKTPMFRVTPAGTLLKVSWNVPSFGYDALTNWLKAPASPWNQPLDCPSDTVKLPIDLGIFLFV